MSSARKYRAENMMPVLRIFVEARNGALAAGFTDSGGAIHSLIENAPLIRMAAKMGKEPNDPATELEQCRNMLRLLELHIELERRLRLSHAEG